MSGAECKRLSRSIFGLKPKVEAAGIEPASEASRS
jgi:hypothetical protein